MNKITEFSQWLNKVNLYLSLFTDLNIIEHPVKTKVQIHYLLMCDIKKTGSIDIDYLVPGLDSNFCSHRARVNMLHKDSFVVWWSTHNSETSHSQSY